MAEIFAILLVVAICFALFAGYPVAFTLGGLSLAFAVLGSLFGIFLMGVYGPVMGYLAVFLIVGLVTRAARAKIQTPGSAPVADRSVDPTQSQKA